MLGICCIKISRTLCISWLQSSTITLYPLEGNRIIRDDLECKQNYNVYPCGSHQRWSHHHHSKKRENMFTFSPLIKGLFAKGKTYAWQDAMWNKDDDESLSALWWWWWLLVVHVGVVFIKTRGALLL